MSWKAPGAEAEPAQQASPAAAGAPWQAPSEPAQQAPVQAVAEDVAMLAPAEPARRRRSVTREFLGDTVADDGRLAKAAAQIVAASAEPIAGDSMQDGSFSGMVEARRQVPWAPIVVGAMLLAGVLGTIVWAVS